MQPIHTARRAVMLKDIYDTEPTEVDQLVFEKLVPPDHYLRRVKRDH